MQLTGKTALITGGGSGCGAGAEGGSGAGAGGVSLSGMGCCEAGGTAAACLAVVDAKDDS